MAMVVVVMVFFVDLVYGDGDKTAKAKANGLLCAGPLGDARKTKNVL